MLIRGVEGGRASKVLEEYLWVMKNNPLFLPESVHYTVSLGVPSLIVSSPAQDCSGGFGESRPNQFGFVTSGSLYRKRVSDVILDLFDVLL